MLARSHCEGGERRFRHRFKTIAIHTKVPFRYPLRRFGETHTSHFLRAET
jgi:hypothetical protein